MLTTHGKGFPNADAVKQRKEHKNTMLTDSEAGKGKTQSSPDWQTNVMRNRKNPKTGRGKNAKKN